MIKILAIVISTIIVLAGCLGFAFSGEIGVIYKDWSLKKSFV